VKIKIRPEQADLGQMTDWPAGFRDGERAERTDADDAGPTGAGPSGPGYAVPASYGYAVPASPGHAEQASYVRAVPARPGYAVPARPGYAVPADSDYAGPAVGSARPQAPATGAAPVTAGTPSLPARSAALTASAGPAGAAVRAVIGDQLRMPIMWCEMGSCISWHADPAALGEADTRARAIAAGWRIDALGRLACPRCQQNDPGYWTARPVVPRDRDTATARTARTPAAPGASAVGRAAPRGSRDSGRAAHGFPLASRTGLEWHHDSPVGEAMPAGVYAANPAGTSHSRGAVVDAVRAWRARGGRQAAPRRPVGPART
jgi:hypothetical protein